ncbi:MAG: ribonuclease H-like YkuK family protein [Alicyclobacillus sp.]|nr:ribonuclease H-like YkuK family protein [Alicyclobacillus sp.]
MTAEEMASDVLAEVCSGRRDEYRIMVGTDSQAKPAAKSVTFVTAVIVHHVGQGGRYYVHREQQAHVYSLRQRMLLEATYSLQTGALLSEHLGAEVGRCPVEVHLDIGERGATRQMVSELVSWITQNGYAAKIKPDAYCASKVADRYTKH